MSMADFLVMMTSQQRTPTLEFEYGISVAKAACMFCFAFTGLSKLTSDVEISSANYIA